MNENETGSHPETTGMTTGMNLGAGQAVEIDKRVDHLVRKVLKRVMIRYVIPAFVALSLAFGGSLLLSLHVLNVRNHDAYCTRVDSREQVRNVIKGLVDHLSPATDGAQASRKDIDAYIDAQYPALPADGCS